MNARSGDPARHCGWSSRRAGVRRRAGCPLDRRRRPLGV